MFKNRTDAAIQLAEKLKKYKSKNGIVLAIPRGGVPIGYIIAKELEFPLEITLSKKIGHPGNPEYAIGSVSLDGIVINDNVPGVSMNYFQQESDRIIKNLKTKFDYYMGDRKMTDLKDKTVIIVDDGIATGSTIIATIHSIRKKNPKEIIIAVPVAPSKVIDKLKNIADEIVCINAPNEFFGVGQFYEDFSQVSDQEVIQLLQKANTGEQVV
jgi:predicted phosphoribosyltransferase